MPLTRLKSAMKSTLFEDIDKLHEKVTAFVPSVRTSVSKIKKEPRAIQAALSKIGVLIDQYKLTIKQREKLKKGYDFVEVPGDLDFIDPKVQRHLEDFFNDKEDDSDDIVERYLRKKKIPPKELYEYMEELKKLGYDEDVDLEDYRTQVGEEMLKISYKLPELMISFVSRVNSHIVSAKKIQADLYSASENIKVQIDQILAISDNSVDLDEEEEKDLKDYLESMEEIGELLSEAAYTVARIRAAVSVLKITLDDYMDRVDDIPFGDDPFGEFVALWVELEEVFYNTMNKLDIKV